MAFIRKSYKIAFSCIIAFLLNVNLSFAVNIDDGFGSARKIEGRYFTVYYAPELEITGLLQKLNISAAEKLLVGKEDDGSFSSETGLADMVDAIFLLACGVLDMNLYSYHGTIKICRDSSQLNGIYGNLFKQNTTLRSFYVNDLNTVYTSVDNFSRGVIGHEIAHAVISHYFVVLPSVKIQEVLAMYVEYQLKR